MPRTAITVTQGTRAGTVITAAVAADTTNGNSVQWDDRTCLVVKNTNAASTTRNVTFTPTRTVDDRLVAPRVITLAAGETRVFSAYDLNDYGTPLAIDGAHAEVTIQAIRV